MVKKKVQSLIKVIPCIIILTLTNACYVPSFFDSTLTEQKIKSFIPIKWQGKDIGIRSLMDIDGYYCWDGYIGDSCVYSSTDNFSKHDGLAFFDDGTYINFESYKEEGNNNIEKISIQESGVYTYSNDTLIIEAFQRFDFGERLQKGLGTRFPILRRFKVIDRNTIEYIDAYNLYRNWYYNMALIRTFGHYIERLPSYDRQIFSFKDTYIFPTTDIMMKEKDWLWENKDDWNVWMNQQQIKENNKMKKTYMIKYDD